MAFKREEEHRAEGVGYYGTSYSDAQDVFNYLTSDMSVEEERPTYYDKIFKVTVIVEEV